MGHHAVFVNREAPRDPHTNLRSRADDCTKVHRSPHDGCLVATVLLQRQYAMQKCHRPGDCYDGRGGDQPAPPRTQKNDDAEGIHF